MTEADITKALSEYVGDQVFFMPQVKTGPTWTNHNLKIVDAITVKRSWTNPCISIYEIKTSRQDFIKDEKWPGYLEFCHRFYFVAPKGIIQKDELTRGVGLVTVNERLKAHTVKAAAFRHLESLPHELFYYIILSRLKSERYPFHETKLAYWQDYIDEKKHKSRLGSSINGLIKQTLIEQSAKIDRLKNQSYEIKRLRKFMDEKNIGIWDLEQIFSNGRKYLTPGLMRALETVARFVNQGQLEL